jgi:hypothetical protein
MSTPPLRATVVYARAERQWLVELELTPGATIRDALVRSGLLEQCAELAGAEPAAGIFHRRLPLETPVRDGDRIEIYRPLQLDPMEARRLRAATRGRAAKAAGSKPA